jgi:signal transduction histidine kinase
MRAHKGAILIDSAPGQGTTFKVLFHASHDLEALDHQTVCK